MQLVLEHDIFINQTHTECIIRSLQKLHVRNLMQLVLELDIGIIVRFRQYISKSNRHRIYYAVVTEILCLKFDATGSGTRYMYNCQIPTIYFKI